MSREKKGVQLMKISANYYSVTPRRFIAGTRGSYGIEKLEISFSEEWNGLTKRVVFYPPASEPVGVMYASGPIDIPMEVMRTRGKTKYAVIGYKDEKKLVTVSGEMDVLGTLDDTEHSALKPTPDEMAQVMEHMQTAVNTARALRTDAANGLFDGRDGTRWHIGSEITGTSDNIECKIEGAFVGDLYLNTDSFAVYSAIADGVWKYIGSTKSSGASGVGSLEDVGVTSFEVDVDTGMLTMTISDNYGVALFELNKNGYLEVNINE